MKKESAYYYNWWLIIFIGFVTGFLEGVVYTTWGIPFVNIIGEIAFLLLLVSVLFLHNHYWVLDVNNFIYEFPHASDYVDALNYLTLRLHKSGILLDKPTQRDFLAEAEGKSFSLDELGDLLYRYYCRTGKLESKQSLFTFVVRVTSRKDLRIKLHYPLVRRYLLKYVSEVFRKDRVHALTRS